MRGPLSDTFEALLKIPATLLLLGGLFYGVYWYLAVHLPDERRARDDPAYAEFVFGGYVAFEEVRESRRWHRHGADAYDCTYAIVSLRTDAPVEPPELPENRRDQPWYWAYGGDWLPTPAPPLGRNRDAVGFCARYFSTGTNERLEAAMAQPGSWHIIGSVGETVHIYSAPHRIAARIRYGD